MVGVSIDGLCLDMLSTVRFKLAVRNILLIVSFEIMGANALENNESEPSTKETTEVISPIVKPLQSIVIKKKSVVVRSSDFELPNDDRKDKWDVNLTSEFTSLGGSGYGIQAEGPLSDQIRLFVSHREGLMEERGLLGPVYSDGTRSQLGIEYKSERTKVRIGVEKTESELDCLSLPVGCSRLLNDRSLMY